MSAERKLLTKKKADMDDRTNTIAGWVLAAAGLALGASIVSGNVFKGERPETMGYPIEGVEREEGEGGAEPEQPIANLLAAAASDPTKGAQVFKKCASCHSIEQGGANGIGPNLYGTMGKPHGHVPGFAYSAALKGKAATWGWEEMNAWLLSPKKYAEGTKMTFAGLSKGEDRAALMLYLNSMSQSPLPLPAATGPTEAAGGPAQPTNPGAGKAENEPIITEEQAAKQPRGNVGGEGAPEVAGGSEQQRDRR